MHEMTRRLRRRVDADFREQGSADEVVRIVSQVSETEHIQAAIVLWADGDLSRIRDSVELSQVDWRDVLVRGGLADEDWPRRLDAELGPTESA